MFIHGEVTFYNLEDDGHISIQHKGRVDKNNSWPQIEAETIDCVNNRREVLNTCVKKKIFNDGKINCAGWQNPRKGNSGYEMIQVKELCEIVDGSLASNECDDDGEYDFITAAEEWKKHSVNSHDCEALIYAVAAAPI